MERFFLNIKVSLSVFFAVINASVGSAATSGVRLSSNGSTAIQEAQKLLLKKERLKATELLYESSKKEKKESATYKELIKAIDQMGEMFLTEKAQQLYELGRSLFWNDTPGALVRFKEAKALEPDNVLLFEAVSRALLKMADCQKSLDNAKAGSEAYPTSKNLALLRVQALACLNQNEEFSKTVDSVEWAAPHKLYVEMARAQSDFLTENYTSSWEHLNSAKSIDGKFPELFYWMGQVADKLGKKPADFYSSYLKFCSGNITEAKRKYELEPRLCLEVKAVEGLVDSKQSGEPQ